MRQIEKEIGKEFVDGTLPSPQEICTKQLYRAMDKIEKVDVDEEQIAPFMEEINRHFEFVDKEDIIKKIVSMTFGRFLAYYADAPEIEKPSGKGEKSARNKEKNGPRKASKGYVRLFINLGKADGFYPGEVMQMLNRYLGGRQQVGHIDLYPKFSYIEVPKQDAQRVMKTLSGTRFKGREVRCNAADEKPTKDFQKGGGKNKNYPTDFVGKGGKNGRKSSKKSDFIGIFDEPTVGDWRELMKPKKWDRNPSAEDFGDEGWALRKPRKKKK